MSGTAPGAAVRVRFCPSPTGNPHVGLMRTALFNHAWARHTGGTFVFRIEDTDAARDTEQSYRDLLDVLRWFSLDWDEGPEVGGPHGPYRQSQRGHLYADAAARLRAAGEAYPCFCTPEEIAARATAAGRPPGYDNQCRTLTSPGRAAFEAEGRPAVLRLRVPDRILAWTDLVRGDVAFAPEHVADYVLVRANGQPLYTLTNPLDDGLMRITDVLRGEDLLASTPRQIALYEALGRVGLTDGTVPRFGHLPYVMGEGNRKLSKRDPQSAVAAYRSRGFLPEGLSNYLALLGWALGPDRDIFDRAEMDAAFDIADVNANPARFDLRKCEAVNAAWVRRLDPDDLAGRLVPVLTAAGLLPEPPDDAGLALVAAVTPLLQERMTVLTDAVDQVRFLFSGADHVVDPTAAATHLVPAQEPLLEASRAALADLPDWTAEAVQAALRGVADTLGLKPRKAFPVLYVAVTGRPTSVPLFDGMALLGREHTLARLSAAVSDLRAGPG